MIDFLKEALKSPAGSFGFIFALLMLAFWVVHIVTKWSAKITHIDELDKKIDNSIVNLDAKFDKRTDKSDAKIDSIKESILEIKAFISVFKENNNQYVARQSPVRLTDKGEEVSKDLGLENLIEKHWLSIESTLATILGKNSNPYDIQQESFKIGGKISTFLDDNEIEFIKNYAFKEGQNLANYDLLIGVCIRDKYFKKHGINVDDIDQFDPLKIQTI